MMQSQQQIMQAMQCSTCILAICALIYGSNGAEGCMNEDGKATDYGTLLVTWGAVTIIAPILSMCATLYSIKAISDGQLSQGEQKCMKMNTCVIGLLGCFSCSWVIYMMVVFFGGNFVPITTANTTANYTGDLCDSQYAWGERIAIFFLVQIGIGCCCCIIPVIMKKEGGVAPAALARAAWDGARKGI